jgi:hypothetical protein
MTSKYLKSNSVCMFFDLGRGTRFDDFCPPKFSRNTVRNHSIISRSRIHVHASGGYRVFHNTETKQLLTLWSTVTGRNNKFGTTLSTCLFTSFSYIRKGLSLILVCDNWSFQTRSQNSEKRLSASSFLSLCHSVSLSVCLSVRMEQLGSHLTDFHEIWYLSIFRTSVEKIQVSLKSFKNNKCFT